MKIKKVAGMFLGVILLFIQGIPLSAQSTQSEASLIEVYENFAPFWTNVNYISLDLYYENGNAQNFASIVGATGTTSINATFTLERQTIFGNWTTVQTWTSRASGSSLTFFETASASKGNKYRLSVTATVVRNGVSETVSTSFEQTF